MRRALALLAAIAFVLPANVVAIPSTTSALVSVGSPTGTTPQNDQNEPAVAMDANHPNILAAGANDAVDSQPCPAASTSNGATCRGSNHGVGGSGIYFSFDSGKTWTQPTYTGLTSRGCNDVDPCTASVGPIGTLPWYYESGLVSDGDPAVAFGPREVNGVFSWANGSRLYYANLVGAINAGFPQHDPFQGALSVGVSRTDDVAAAAASDKNAWLAPVIVTTRTSSTSFEDKDQIWADNAASSPFFGNVYVCDDEYRSRGHGGFAQGFAQTVLVSRSTDGGETWTTKQTRAADSVVQLGFHGVCTVRTDGNGVVYLFYSHFAVGTPGRGAHTMQKSFDGGQTWTQPIDVQSATDGCYDIDPVEGSCVEDGVAGARIAAFSSPSIDIANGAPTGADATNEIVDVWNDGSFGLNHEATLISYSLNGGMHWSNPVVVSVPGDRPLYAATAIAPDGGAVYVVYEAVTSPYQSTTTSPRPYHGLFLMSALAPDGAPMGWTTLMSGPVGDLRGTYPGHDLYQERVGDYVYSAAGRTYGVGVWSDASDAADCADIDTWRQNSFTAGTRLLPAPYPPTDCPATFGNVQIRAVTTG